MYTLSKFAGAHFARRVAIAGSAVLALCAVSAGCQSGNKSLAGVGFEQRSAKEPQVLFESDRRDIIMHFTESRMNGLVDDDSFVAYMSVPLDPVSGPQFDEPGFAVGWGNSAVALSRLFDGANGNDTPVRLDDPEMDLDANELLVLSLERNKVYDPAQLREIDPGVGLQILDYASLIEPVELASDLTNPENRSTD